MRYRNHKYMYRWRDRLIDRYIYVFMYIKCNSLIRIYPRVTMIMRPSILNRVTHGNNPRPIIRSNRGQSSFRWLILFIYILFYYLPSAIDHLYHFIDCLNFINNFWWKFLKKSIGKINSANTIETRVLFIQLYPLVFPAFNRSVFFSPEKLPSDSSDKSPEPLLRILWEQQVCDTLLIQVYSFTQKVKCHSNRNTHNIF